MKEISFKMRKNYEQNRKFCVVKVETLIACHGIITKIPLTFHGSIILYSRKTKDNIIALAAEF